LEDRRNVGESNCNSGDGTVQTVQSLMFMMIMMIMMMMMMMRMMMPQVTIPSFYFPTLMIIFQLIIKIKHGEFKECNLNTHNPLLSTISKSTRFLSVYDCLDGQIRKVHYLKIEKLINHKLTI